MIGRRGLAGVRERVGQRTRVVGGRDRRARIEAGRQGGGVENQRAASGAQHHRARVRSIRIEHHGSGHQRAGQQDDEETPPNQLSREAAPKQEVAKCVHGARLYLCFAARIDQAPVTAGLSEERQAHAPRRAARRRGS
ncbi:hypothetical protein Bsp3421_000759 [Burkholderia sp. FERM BP-3421]|nr:hypothetical protein [Burkholderia sp. FERM BP-3421]WDD90878.1 hypothetical protein Bsp3421_000759 [Burkholderia sp. FERM BP-3421]